MSKLRNASMRPAYLIPLVLMLCAAVGMGMAIKAYGYHLKKKPIYAPGGRLVSSLPSETLHWIRNGSDRTESAETIEALGTQNYLSRRYVRKDSIGSKKIISIEIHVAYYTGMIDTVPHVPERCFVAGGMLQVRDAVIAPMKLDQSRWSPDKDVQGDMAGRIWHANLVNQYGANAGRVHLPRDPENIKLRVSEFTVDGTKLLAGYFFIANGGTTPEAENVRLLAFNLEDEYAYFCKVQFTSSSVDTAEELNEQASSLLSDLLPDLMQCVPDWVSVQAGEYPEDNPNRKSAAALPEGGQH